jgi:hypothetical protein
MDVRPLDVESPGFRQRHEAAVGGRIRAGAVGGIAALALIGLLLEAVLVVGFLLPLSIWRHSTVLRAPDGLARVLGDDALGALRLTSVVAVAFAVFGVALWTSLGTRGRAARRLVLAGSLLFAATMVPLNPLGAHDVYHNVFDARIFWVHHGNPTQQPPLAFPHDPLLRSVPSWRGTPSAYGPLWYLLAGLPLPFAGDGIWANVIGQKLIAVAFLLVLTGLAMATAEHVRPGYGAAAGVLVGWNPLLLFEAAGNAHNDVVMACFAVAALYAAVRRRWPLVFPLLSLSIASKEILAVLGPVLLVYALRRGNVPRRSIALSLALGAALLVCIYAPFFAGSRTIAGLGREADHVTSSPGALLYLIVRATSALRWQLVLGAMKLVAWPVFLLGYVLLLRGVWRVPSPARLTAAAFWTVFLLVALLTWWFMPWYLFWLVPLAALTADRRCFAVAALFSACAMLMYVPHFWLAAADPLLREAVSAAVAFTAPLALAFCLSAEPSRPRLRDHSLQPAS